MTFYCEKCAHSVDDHSSIAPHICLASDSCVCEGFTPREVAHGFYAVPIAMRDSDHDAHPAAALWPTGYGDRKAIPVFDGVLMYFPLAIAEVARVSVAGNKQHNPGEPLHWARSKSTDQLNTALRHLIDHGLGNTKDTDGTYHLAKTAWRALAALELTLEAELRDKQNAPCEP